MIPWLQNILNKIAALNDLSAADVNAEVDSALDTIAPASPTAGSLLDILSKAAGGNTFDKSTDSLEAIREKLDTLPSTASSWGFTSTQNSTSNAAYQTILDITGSGMLHSVIFRFGNATYGIKVTIDGTAYEFTTGSVDTNYMMIHGYSPLTATALEYVTIASPFEVNKLNIWFKSSLKIELKGDGSHPAYVKANYSS